MLRPKTRKFPPESWVSMCLHTRNHAWDNQITSTFWDAALGPDTVFRCHMPWTGMEAWHDDVSRHGGDHRHDESRHGGHEFNRARKASTRPPRVHLDDDDFEVPASRRRVGQVRRRSPLSTGFSNYGAGTTWLRHFIFLQDSTFIQIWDVMVGIGVAYSTAFLPLALVFVQARFDGHVAVQNFIDASLMIDVVVRFRTSFSDRGYEVTNGYRIAVRYLYTWFIFDFLSSFPFSTLAGSQNNVIRMNTTITSVEVHPLEWLGLLRVLSFGRCVRVMGWLFSTRFIRLRPGLAMLLKVMSLLYTFCLMAHYLGLVWYMVAIRPLEASAAYDGVNDWFWLHTNGYSDAYITGVRYTCSIYWALSVMTNLKGHVTHENRRCLYHNVQV